MACSLNIVCGCVWRVGGGIVCVVGGWPLRVVGGRVGVSACVRACWVDGGVGVWRVCKWADVYVGWLCWFVVCVVG